MTVEDVSDLLQEYEAGVYLQMEVPVAALRILSGTHELEESWAMLPGWVREEIREMGALARKGELRFFRQRDLDECLRHLEPVLVALSERGLLPEEATGEPKVTRHE